MAERNELKDVINRIVEIKNHEIVKDILTREFKSRDLGSLMDLPGKKMEYAEAAKVVRDVIDQAYKIVLRIQDESEREIRITDMHVKKIEDWLVDMDLMIRHEFKAPVYKDGVRAHLPENRFLCAQPGLRWSQAETLVIA